MNTTRQRWPSPGSELRELANKYCDELLTADEARRLEGLLRANEQLQLQFLAYCDVHARLQWEFGPTVPSCLESPVPLEAVPIKPAREVSAASGAWNRRSGLETFRRYRRPLAACVVAACVLATAWLVSHRFAEPDSIAVLRRVHNAQWGEGISALEPGTPLFAGQFRLEQGVVELCFSSGVVAVLEGPARLELRDPLGGILHQGQIVLRVPPEATGFRLETRSARLIDQGTEFGVRVDETGVVDLQVYDGRVIAELKSAAGASHVVGSGEAIRIAGGPWPLTQDLQFYPYRFVRYLPGPDDPTGRGVDPYNEPRYDAVHVVPTPTDVVIDGDLSDWDLSGRFRSACESPYDALYHLEGAMMFDDEYLYVGAHVGDPFPMRSIVSPSMERNLYGHGGSVALRLSVDREMGWPARGEHFEYKRAPPEAHDLNDKLIFVVLWYCQAEDLACIHLRYGMDFHGSQVNPAGYRGAFRKDADERGYTLEYAIPWNLLNAEEDPPQGGDVLAAAWLAHWSDEGGRDWKGQLVDILTPGETGWNYARAATWGKAFYHRAGRLPPGTVRRLPE